MSVTFACRSCGKSFTVNEGLAGRRVKCKACGSLIEIPAATPTRKSEGGLQIDDLYGVDDGPAVASSRPRAPASAAPKPRARPDDDVDDVPPPPRRSSSGNSGKKKRRRSIGGSGPWGIPLRQAGASCLILGLVVGRAERLIPAIKPTIPMMPSLGLGGLCMMIGMLLTLLSFGGATLSLICGNREAFESESSGARAGWFLSGLLSLLILAAFMYGFTHPRARLAGQPAGFNNPAVAASAPMPSAPDNPSPPGSAGPDVGSDVKVTLTGGQFMRNTSPIGTAQPGVEISVDYTIESGQIRPPERYVLVIKSRKGRGELDNLHEMMMRSSGSIHASSFMATPEEGPYEAWVEVASRPGPRAQRKQVSNTISLQFANVPVRNLAQEAQDSARDLAAQQQQMLNQQQRMMEEQRQRMMNSIPGPMGPRFGGGMR